MFGGVTPISHCANFGRNRFAMNRCCHALAAWPFDRRFKIEKIAPAIAMANRCSMKIPKAKRRAECDKAGMQRLLLVRSIQHNHVSGAPPANDGLIHRRLHADIANCQLNRKKTFWQTLSHYQSPNHQANLGIHIDNQSTLHFTSQNISPSRRHIIADHRRRGQ